MSLGHFWGKAFADMTSKSAKKAQEKRNVATSNTEKVQDGGAKDEEMDVLSPAMTKAMATVTANISQVIETKFDSFLEKIRDISKELHDTTKRVGEAEQRISAAEDASMETGKRVAYLEKVVASLQERLDDQEDRGRRKNIRIIGLPESSEGSSAVQFMESWLPKALALNTKDGKIKLERAHRVSGPTRRGPDSRRSYPRAMIVRFHHYNDRARVLEAARRIKEVRFEDNRIFLFQDFSSGTQRKRRAFDEARRRLQSLGLHTYGLNYPATLRITVNNTTKFFTKPEEAMAYINTLDGEGTVSSE